MIRHKYIFMIVTVLLLISVCACTGGEVDATPDPTPEAIPEEAVQPPIQDEPPAQASNVPT